MSSLVISAALLAVLFTTLSSALDEDFGFDVSDEFEVERKWNNKEISATVGKVFHLVIPKEAFPGEFRHYEVKRSGGTPLPSWLLFDKVTGVFWGVPLIEDVDTLYLIIRPLGHEKNISEELTINIVEAKDVRPADKCPNTEDNTVLTLLIDRGVRAIKPKQKVIAINNIANFFGLPYSAFTLKPQLEKDDITASSVILAGPGNLNSRSSKLTSSIELPVGCGGRIWMQIAPIIHQIKQQALDGTLSEVLGLPVMGWRIKTESKAILRSKRQVEDYGSGDYDDEDYYDDNYDENYEDEEEENVATTPKITTMWTTMKINSNPTHPHRHHHGEVINPEDNNIEIPLIRDRHQESTPRNEFETESSASPIVSERVDTTPTSTLTAITTSATTAATQKQTTQRETTIIPSSSTTSRTTKQDGVTSQSNFIKSDPNYDYEDYADYDQEDDNEEYPVETKTIVPKTISSAESSPETTIPNEPPTTSMTKLTAKDFTVDNISPTTLTDSETTLMIVEDTEAPTVTYYEENVGVTASPVATTILPPTVATTSFTSTSLTNLSTTITTITTTTPVPVSTTTERVPTTENEETTIKLTTARHIISSPRTTTIREITESFEFETKNFVPYIENRLKQMSVVAGKIFRFVVPKNTFKDLEDGYNLTLQFLNSKGEPLSKDSWCHFNPLRREIYGLPLEEDVSKWEYVLKAIDREGASVNDTFTIQVQQHKSQRVVNHEISLYMRIEKRQEFPHFVDWCLKTLRALGRIYNTNMTEITVRHVNYTSDPVVFTWTNDSIPTNHCPTEEIDKLFDMLTATDSGDPSQQLYMLLAPELRVKKVTKYGLGVCEAPQVPMTPPTNFPPFLRNPVDHINATVGELLVFKVPDDTFYDPEDTDSRTLNITLLTGDRQPIKPHNWLQFDRKNREFYGIPRKPGRSEYQLICADSAGLDATDSLEIVVYPAPKIHYNVEFSMTVETPYDNFANNAAMQRKFVEKLQEIFGDRNSSFIHLSPFKRSTIKESTIVTWYNKSLSTVKCPYDEISHLESIIKSDDRSISSRVSRIMQPEFPISTIKVLHTDNCRTKPPTPPYTPPHEEINIPIDEKAAEASPDNYQYLMTFIVPVVIISIMLFLAAVAACVLYRKKRTGKMNVEEDGRPSYGNKGIPVIFQEELEEKPESGTKTPVILKDEKPPLAPPEYSKSGSLKLTDDSEPYQPPPPFTRTQDNGRQPRPKPTPTYRKPPPYVPP